MHGAADHIKLPLLEFGTSVLRGPRVSDFKRKNRRKGSKIRVQKREGNRQGLAETSDRSSSDRRLSEKSGSETHSPKV